MDDDQNVYLVKIELLRFTLFFNTEYPTKTMLCAALFLPEHNVRIRLDFQMRIQTQFQKQQKIGSFPSKQNFLRKMGDSFDHHFIYLKGN